MVGEPASYHDPSNPLGKDRTREKQFAFDIAFGPDATQVCTPAQTCAWTCAYARHGVAWHALARTGTH